MLKLLIPVFSVAAVTALGLPPAAAADPIAVPEAVHLACIPTPTPSPSPSPAPSDDDRPAPRPRRNRGGGRAVPADAAVLMS